MLVADFHAHLLTNEVIGFCAGSLVNPPARGPLTGTGPPPVSPPLKRNPVFFFLLFCTAIAVTHVFPCKSLVSGMDNVEMDPSSEMEMRNQIHEANLQVVGWYHSHPYFQPDPSLVDIHNQSSYQQLFRDEDFRDDPFIGVIVGPFPFQSPVQRYPPALIPFQPCRCTRVVVVWCMQAPLIRACHQRNRSSRRSTCHARPTSSLSRAKSGCVW